MTDEEQTDVDADTVASQPMFAPGRVDTPDTLPARGALPRAVGQTEEPDLASQSTLSLSAQPLEGVDSFVRDQVLSSLFTSFQRPQRKIDRFHILDRLGAGGMGVVYSGYDEDLDRRIAIKLVRSPDADRADIYAKRLLREARVMAKFGHPNVVHVYQAGLSEDGTFIAMEFIEGQTLADWLAASEQRSWREVVGIFVQAGRGLAAAHAAGIVHRDFKPANAMIDQQGVVKVLDFGLARDGSPSESIDAGGDLDTVGSKARERLTQTGAMMGTPAYMSPEQFHGRPATAKSDQYNFSVALYQGLYGELPFPTLSMKVLLEAVSSGAVLPPPVNHNVPDWVRQRVLRGLSSDPERRHESMDALLDALERDPVRRRRRFMGIGAAAFSIGLAGYALNSYLTPSLPPSDPQSSQSCVGVGDEITQVWNTERREAIGRALVSTEVGHAAEVWERVAPQIDDYVADWADMRREACEIYNDGGETPEYFDLRTQCLDRRLTTLKEVLSLADKPMPITIDKLPIAVAGLPSIDSCADSTALHNSGVAAPDPTDAAKVRELRNSIAATKAYELLGQFDEGLELIKPIVAQAESLGYGPLEAEALLQQGYLQELSSTEASETLASLHAAKLRAIEAKDLELTAEAASRHARVRADGGKMLDAALEESEEVNAYLMQFPYARKMHGVSLNDLAHILGIKGEHARAVDVFQQALEVKRKAFGERHHEVAYTLYNLSMVYMEQGAFRDASTSFVEALEIAIETLGPNHPHTVMINSSYAENLIYQGCRTEAGRVLEQVLAGSERGTWQLRYLMTKLRLLERNYVEARAQAELMLEDAETGESTPDTVLSLQELAKVEFAEGQVDLAMASLKRARDRVVTDLGEEHPLYAQSLRSLAEMERRAGHHEGAIEQNHQVLKLLEGIGLGESSETYWTHLSLGRAQADAGQMADANQSFQNAIALREKLGIADDGLSRARLELERSKVLLALGLVEAAQETLELAVDTFKDGCEGDSLELALSRFGLARALMRLEVVQPERAEQLSERAEQLSGLASSALAQRGTAFAEETAQVDAWRREQGWS